MENLIRSSGILLPITALPSSYGIGSMGRTAREFLQFLHQSGQHWWQLLPAGHTGYGDSPYQAFSAFAGNPYWIDLEALAADGLLTTMDLQKARNHTETVDYGWLAQTRIPLLRKAYLRIEAEERNAMQAFARTEGRWIWEYAVFMAQKEQNAMQPWTAWNNWEIPSNAMVAFYIWVQYRFFQQWDRLRHTARTLGIQLLGDLPLYVAYDSADVFMHPAWFQLDAVAGVPPDAFAATGQRWGNPLYRWDAMAAEDYSWWRARIRMAARLYDAVRMDHFRGLSSYWKIPADCKTAEIGRWEIGPGVEFVRLLQAEVPQLQLVGEDLGAVTPELPAFLQDCRLPGMRVLQFACTDPEGEMQFPQYAPEQSVYYVGTHDNASLLEWLETVDANLLTRIVASPSIDPTILQHQVLCAAMQSPAALCILRMQDVLGIGKEGRINIPGTAAGNWKWRLQTLPSQEISNILHKWTVQSDRIWKR